MNELISIIMPVYKVKEHLLRRAIESVLAQLYYDIELILVDDGSPDNCGQICDEYAQKDKRVVVFHTSNQGVSQARNCGLQHARGKYVSFADSDDSLDPYMLETLYENLKNSQADCAVCSCCHVFDEAYQLQAAGAAAKKDSRIYTRNEILDVLFYMKHPYAELEITAVWGKMYKREMLSGISFDKRMRIGEDFKFNYEVFSKTESVVCIDYKGYYYLINQNGAMRNGFNINKMESLDVLVELAESAEQLSNRAGLVSRLVNIAIVLLLMIPVESEYEVHRRRIKQFVKKYRFRTICNVRTRNKVRFSLYLSYLGFDTMQKIFSYLK